MEYVAALNVKEEIASADDALQSIVNMSKLKLPKEKLRLLDGNYEDAQDFNYDATTNLSDETRKQVAFVLLRQYEKANQVVLSSAEKYSYGKAMLEPLLQHLAELSSADFYQEPSAWKETVEIGLRRKNKENSIKDEEDVNVPESHMYSMLDPADAMGAASIMEALETSGTDDCTDGSSDDGGIPPTQPAEDPPLSPRLISHDQLDEDSEKASTSKRVMKKFPITIHKYLLIHQCRSAKLIL